MNYASIVIVLLCLSAIAALCIAQVAQKLKSQVALLGYAALVVGGLWLYIITP